MCYPWGYFALTKIVNICNIANIERAIKDVIDPEQNHGEGDGLRTNVS